MGKKELADYNKGVKKRQKEIRDFDRREKKGMKTLRKRLGL